MRSALPSKGKCFLLLHNSATAAGRTFGAVWPPQNGRKKWEEPFSKSTAVRYLLVPRRGARISGTAAGRAVLALHPSRRVAVHWAGRGPSKEISQGALTLMNLASASLLRKVHVTEYLERIVIKTGSDGDDAAGWGRGQRLWPRCRGRTASTPPRSKDLSFLDPT